ncbi:hypothetical protein HCG51_34175 (plasmid) [Tolypothrix sp. PCC 7910]|uniref:hypothetical protein n=1 Tax=Tolypothrix sp. PCC 7910 TaxID=2099387 RepID=UPI0014278472|nr:hypothetical protein [Tolypothrix sp. PCC 7910]QIR41736.1 hypothetical protein HCG51_34175 [Tolypothrix sp. PCC 7910]
MKSRLFQATVAALTIFTSMSASSAMADSVITVQRQINIPDIELRPTTSISGVITNGGSNNGGQPNFTCDEIQVYVVENITPPPSGSGITLPEYKQIGSSAKATGNIATGCKYTLSIAAKAIGKSVYVFATSPTKWTTFVNVVEVSAANFSNPIKVNKNDHLTNMNLTIRATAIK